MQKPQYAILRFAKYKGPEIGQIEAHNERKRRNTPVIPMWMLVAVISITILSSQSGNTVPRLRNRLPRPDAVLERTAFGWSRPW